MRAAEGRSGRSRTVGMLDFWSFGAIQAINKRLVAAEARRQQQQSVIQAKNRGAKYSMGVAIREREEVGWGCRRLLVCLAAARAAAGCGQRVCVCRATHCCHSFCHSPRALHNPLMFT